MSDHVCKACGKKFPEPAPNVTLCGYENWYTHSQYCPNQAYWQDARHEAQAAILFDKRSQEPTP